MELNWGDIAVFVGFFAVVVGFSMYMSRREKTSEDYFLASRGLRWWLIGVSIVAANISTEQFVGMAGQGAGSVGLAVSGYQLFGAVTIVLVAVLFLPRFLRAGIYTMPEYLEYRYSPAARAIMAFYTMVIYVGVLVAAVVYSGALTLNKVFDMNLYTAAWLIGAIAMVYTTWGGLKAVVWADLFQGSALLIGGLVTLGLGLYAVGGVPSFLEESGDRLHMVLPADHPSLPWTALVLGLWIPNFYYCGLNQFIVQRTLAAKTLRQGQLGIILAAALWLIVPFAIVMPGIIAFQLFPEQLAGTNADKAFPTLIRHLIPSGLRGFIFAAISGAVISSLASMLNSASTIFTMDLYQRHANPRASQGLLVAMGRVTTLLFVVVGCVIAPELARFGEGIFSYIQEFQGFISPGILAVFVFGFLFTRAPAAAAVTALLLNVPVYGLLWYYSRWVHEIAFLNRMAITFGVAIAAMALITAVWPLREPKVLPVREDIDMRPAPSVLWLGAAVIAGVAAFYAVFW
jgi:SSS family solute:Na+ symporter